MGAVRIAGALDIAVSGLRAQSTRLSVIGNNIANANTTHAADGKPYRRKDVRLQTGGGLEGVKVQSLLEDQSDFQRIYDPGNPDAKDGYVESPNVQLPVEMMHMMRASQSYQANAAVLKRYLEAMDVTAELLK